MLDKCIRSKIPLRIRRGMKIVYYNLFDKSYNYRSLVQLSRHNRELKDSKIGKECYLIASGPSLSNANLDEVVNGDIITMSSSFLNPIVDKISPVIHVEAPLHAPFDQDDLYSEYMRQLDNVFSGSDTRILFGVGSMNNSYFEKIEERRLGEKNINYTYGFVNYVSSLGYDGLMKDHDCYWDISKSPFSPSTVSHSALQIAMYMGYSNIYLLGFDANRVLEVVNKQHLYFHEPLSAQLAANDNLNNVKMSNYFNSTAKTFSCYDGIADYANKKGINIINLTPNSWLDMFENRSAIL
jgi:hypothetical protein